MAMLAGCDVCLVDSITIWIDLISSRSSMSQPIVPSVAVNSMDQATGHGASSLGQGPLPSALPVPSPGHSLPPHPINPIVSMALKPLPGANGWFYDKADLRRTPSILDGISYEKEQRYRREGARFIIKVGSKLNLRYDTMATGVVYYHRFYCCHSFKVLSKSRRDPQTTFNLTLSRLSSSPRSYFLDI